jgi:predicted nucleotidyltransferase
MDATSGHRQQLLDGLRRFVVSARQIAGVQRIAVLGSIVTTKPDPKDIDVLVGVADDADLTPLATCSRRCRGTHRVSIVAPTCFSPTSAAPTLGGRVTGRTAGLVYVGRAMRFIAVYDPISTTISMRFA